MALAVVAMGFGLFFSSLSNGNLGLTLVIVGLMLLPLNPWIHRRTPRRLDIDTHFIRFLRGNSVLKLLPWNRVEKIYYGRMKRRRMRRTFPVGTGNERVYISFIASTDLQSIRVERFEYELKPDDIQRVLASISELTKKHSIPVEEKERLVFS